MLINFESGAGFTIIPSEENGYKIEVGHSGTDNFISLNGVRIINLLRSPAQLGANHDVYYNNVYANPKLLELMQEQVPDLGYSFENSFNRRILKVTL